MSKIIECSIYRRLLKFISANNILTDCQHGFRPEHSTCSACSEFITEILKNLDEGCYVAVILFDLTAAFDTVDHNFMLNKLNALGIRGKAFNWIQSYLSNRKLIVDTNGCKSEMFDTTIGVPQGSNLGPILFLLYINDLPLYLTTGKTIMYADDTSVIVSAKTINELTLQMNLVLDEFNSWCKKNHLIVNFSKTKYLIFDRSNCAVTIPTIIYLNQKIEQVYDAKFLGVHIESSFKWSIQIDKICKTLNKVYYFIRKLKEIFDCDTLLNVYYSFAYSAIKYCIILWGHAPESIRIFRAQKRLLRLIYNFKRRESCRQIFKDKKILTFYGIYAYELIIYIKNNLNNLPLNSHVHSYDTRINNNIHINKYKTKKFSQSPICKGSNLYNKLPETIKNVNHIKKFKSELKKYLINICPYDSCLNF